MPLGRFEVSVMFAGCAVGCTTAPPPAASPAAPPPAMAEAIRASQPPPAVEAPTEPSTDPVERGELPWWHALSAGVYRFGERTVVLGVGRATDHHHIAEGYMKARVTARLAVRKAAEPVRFDGTMPEPRMIDLFITREQKFLSLYVLDVPAAATVPEDIRTVNPPQHLEGAGRRRVGRHVYDGDEHLYLECEIEGPIANPDWGRSKASAWLMPHEGR
ncbi:MAG: hypothetical protein RIT81_45530 [Deltaproteobacteria bacterium]